MQGSKLTDLVIRGSRKEYRKLVMIGKGTRGAVLATSSVICIALNFVGVSIAQSQAVDTPPACDRERALFLVQQQVTEAQKIEDATARVRVLVKIADVLWPYQETAARDVFARAYELAETIQHDAHKEVRNDRKDRTNRAVRSATQDVRFDVLRAIARRDPAWAHRLAEQAAEQAREKAQAEKDAPSTNAGISSELFQLATAMLTSDKQSAMSLARRTFRYPAGDDLARFLFALAGIDQQASDLMYRETLAGYAEAPTTEFLYLSAYPFGLSRIFGPEAMSTSFAPPPGFQPGSFVQRAFLDAMFRRVTKGIESAAEVVGISGGVPDSARLYLALNELELILPGHQPEYVTRLYRELL